MNYHKAGYLIFLVFLSATIGLSIEGIYYLYLKWVSYSDLGKTELYYRVMSNIGHVLAVSFTLLVLWKGVTEYEDDSSDGY